MAEIIKQIFAGFSETITGLGAGIKDAFMNLFYVNPTAEVLVVSDVAKFGFLMLGLTMATGLVFGAVRLVKGRG